MKNEINIIPALKVNQWLKIWDKVQFNNSGQNIKNRKKPQPYMYMFTMKAGLLRKLAEVYRRKADSRRYTDLGTQRKHDEERSKEISRYIINGYPLSEMQKKDSALSEYNDLRMPGWLPTAILANILSPGSKRGNAQISEKDVIKIVTNKTNCFLQLPQNVYQKNWQPKTIPPIEIIDGQHRLWAFEIDKDISNDFELPVIAFYDLDITWQAYLFYTINVKPKKINRSLAYDLYPILRVQDWLEKSPDSANIYRETRAQEIVEILWSYNNSPWKNRINMLGDIKSNATITQAAFIRNIMASFIKTKKKGNIGGLFGSVLNDSQYAPLDWNRTQQASFIILLWQLLFDVVKNTKSEWTKKLRVILEQPSLFDLENKYTDTAFFGKYSLISTDQGVRGVLLIINDFCFLNSGKLKLREINWRNKDNINESRVNDIEIQECINALKSNKVIYNFIKKICEELVQFNWRTSSEPSLDGQQKREQMVYKGSSGYKELRTQLLKIITHSNDKELAKLAMQVMSELNYVE